MRRLSRDETIILQEAVRIKRKMNEADLSSVRLPEEEIPRDERVQSAIVTGKIKDLAGADLSFLDLTGANLVEADLSGANLSNVDLTGADLFSAILTNVNFTGAILVRADLWDSDVEGANFEGADLREANLPEGWEEVTVGTPATYPEDR